MNKIAVILVVLCSMPATDRGTSSDLRHQVVASFAVKGVPAIRALLDLSRTENVPLGIVEDDGRLCTTEVSYSAKNGSVPTIIQGIVAQVPGYKSTPGASFSILIISPVRPRLVTQQFLSLVDEHYGPIKGTPQMLLTTLWVHVRSVLHPDEGTAVSIFGSPSDPTFELEVRNETVQGVLNSIAIQSSGTWVLRPLPDTLSKLGTETPFSIFPHAGNSAPGLGELCKPMLKDAQD